MTLTSTAIDALPKGKALKDDRVPGLEARRNAGGVSFLLYYRTRTGEQRRPKIGNYPTVSVKDARDIARGMLARVAGGGDPAKERSDARQDPTMDDLWSRCEQDHYNRGTAWHREAKRLYARHVKPQIGKIRVRAVGYPDVNQVHQRLRDRPIEGNRTIAVLSRILTEAERLGWRDRGSNPCALVERFPERKRRRYATAEEIKALGEALDRHAADPVHLSGVAFIWLMLFSGARPSELINGTPDMLQRHGEAGVLRLEHGKTGQRDVFLPAQAMAVIDRLPADRKTLTGRNSVPRKLWAAIRKEAGFPDLWVRDLRRTFATVALSNGVPIGKVGELLGHASTQTTKIYAKLMEDEAHAAAAAVAGNMERILGGGR